MCGNPSDDIKTDDSQGQMRMVIITPSPTRTSWDTHSGLMVASRTPDEADKFLFHCNDLRILVVVVVYCLKY